MFLRNFDNFMMALLGMGHSEYKTTKPASGTGSYINAYGVITVYGGPYLGTSTNFGDGYISLKSTGGQFLNCMVTTALNSGYGNILAPQMMAQYSICLSNGTTPVTYEDYRLSGDLIYPVSNMTFVSMETNYISETKAFRRIMRYAYTNNGTDDIVISEWGLFGHAVANTYSDADIDNSSSTDVLYFREVLDAPITIAAGTTGTLTFSIDLPMFHHP